MCNFSDVTIYGFIQNIPKMEVVNGKMKSNFILSFSQDSKNQKKSVFNEIDVVCSEKIFLSSREFIHEGSGVIIIGKIKQERVESEDGLMNQRFFIEANDLRKRGLQRR